MSKRKAKKLPELPSEIEMQYRATLGEPFGAVYYALTNELVWLHDKWREYRTLFGTSPERIELLNKAASRFFSHVDAALWEDVLLHLCRLTDPPRIGSHEQLTICRLPELITDVGLRSRVEKLIKTALHEASFARDWRDRHIGHRSLARVTDPRARPLAKGSRLHVERALNALDQVLVSIQEAYFGGGIDLAPPGGPGDAADLLRVLSDGVEAGEEREERFRTHNLLQKDFLGPPAV